MALPLAPGEQLVAFPSTRSELLPHIVRRLDNWHPSLPESLRSKNFVRRVFVALLDCRPEAQRQREDFDAQQGVPLLPNSQMARLGLLELRKGDVVFFRDTNDPEFPAHDEPQIFVATTEEVAQFKSDWEDIRKTCIGTPGYRRKHQKTPMETWTSSTRVQDRERCIGMGLTLERPKNVTGPIKGSDPSKYDQEEIHARSELHKISATIGINMLRNRFNDHYCILDAHAQAINLPRVGVDTNCLFPSGQVNFSKPRSRATAKSMKHENGKSGDAHMDETDAPASFSVALADSDVPKGYEPGRFHFLTIGAYIAFDGLTVWAFSGLFHHGGAPPLAPEGVKECDIDWRGVRFLVVLYANRKILDGNTLHNMSAVAGVNSDHPRSVNRMGPELTTDLAAEAQYPATDRMYTRDGRSIMQAQALRNLLVRAGIFNMADTLRQADLGFNIDADAFVKSIVFDTAEGPVTSDPWPLAPAGYESGKDASGNPRMVPRASKSREQAFQEYRQLAERRAKYVPHLAAAPRVKSKTTRGVVKKKAVTSSRPVTRASTTGRQRRTRTTDGDVPSDGPDDDEQWTNALRSSIQYRVRYKETDEEEYVALDDISCDNLLAEYHLLNKIAIGPKGLIEADGDSDACDEDSWAEEQLVTELVTCRSPTPETASGGPIEPASEGLVEAGSEEIPLVAALPDAIESLAADFESAIQIARDGQISMSELHANVLELNRVFSIISPAANAPLSGPAKDVPLAALSSELDTAGSAMVAVMELPERLRRIGTIGEVIHLEASFQRQSVMLANLTLERWINMLSYHILGYGALSSYEDTWIGFLYNRAYATVGMPHMDGCTITFNSAEAHSAFPSRVYNHTLAPGYSPPRGAALVAPLHQLIQRVLDTWFGLTEPSPHRRFRVWLIDALLKLYPSDDVLLLEPVWRAYKDPRGGLIKRPNRSRHSATDSDYRALERALGALPALNPEHEAHAQQLASYRRLAANADAYLGALLSSHYPTHQLAKSTAPTQTFIPPPPGLRSSSPLDVGDTAAAPPAGGEAAIQHMVKFIRDLLPLVSPSASGEGDDESPLLSMVRPDQDGLLPFRERGPSRRLVLHPEGPFGSEHLRSQGAIFSAMLFRGILFNTKAMEQHDGHGYFADLGAWLEFRGTGGADDEAYYCNKAAYGRTKGRTTDHAHTFWTLTPELHRLLFHTVDGRTPPRSFHDVFKHIKNAYPTFGDLTAFLVTGDFTYAGLVAPLVTIEELSYYVFTLRMGAFRALGKLRVPCTSKEEVASSLAFLYRGISEGLSAEEQECIGWDLLMFEHALCKFSKLASELHHWRWCGDADCQICRDAQNKRRQASDDDDGDRPTRKRRKTATTPRGKGNGKGRVPPTSQVKSTSKARVKAQQAQPVNAHIDGASTTLAPRRSTRSVTNKRDSTTSNSAGRPPKRARHEAVEG
ncbi:hypothetical protein K525DRAFT_269489 [Schizophyllum commune Loenen D]|nr:hypothetical protein K525DRAFT_269489 [Schizophyllum commune Loenen D]